MEEGVFGMAIDISMPPDVWGPIFWNTMHILSLGYPVEPTDADKAAAKQFFQSLKILLPCPVCREHYKQQVTDAALDEAVQSKGQLIHWVWELHNRVNKMLGKSEFSMDAFLENMQRMGARKCSPFKCDVDRFGSGQVAAAAVLGGIAIGIGGVWLYRRYYGSKGI
jgi:Erv1 / Alr family